MRSVAQLLTPEVKARATAARRRARPVNKASYAKIGRRGELLRTVHRVRAERALGKPLPALAVVHHADGTKSPDAPLVICQDEAYHHLLHFRMRIKAAGGNPDTDRICSRCKTVQPLQNFNKNHFRKADGLDSFCRRCISEKNAVQRQRRKASPAGEVIGIGRMTSLLRV